MTPESPRSRPAAEVEPSPFDPPATTPGRRRLLVGVFALVAAAALFAAYRLTRSSTAGGAAAGHNHAALATSDRAMPVTLSDASQQRIGVTFAAVELAPMDREVRAVAVVTYDETRLTAIAPKIDGYVERLYVNFTGQPVERGQPLFSIYSPMVVTTQQELLLATRLERDVAGGTPEAVRAASDLVAAARRRLLYWDVPADQVASVEASGEPQRTITLRSPATGVVVDKPVLEGQRIMAGEPVYRVADLREVWLEGEIFEKDLPAIRLHQTVTAEFPALPGAVRRGHVTYIYPTLNPDTRTARVRVALANPDLALKPGMYATIILNAATTPVLSVPRSALLSTGRRHLVFVRTREGTLVPRDVTPGMATDDRIQVLRGLSLGDTVVASATFLVDAESNLGSALGGMANMPGMDMQAPAAPPPRDSMADMPGMDHSQMPGMDRPTMPGMDHSTMPGTPSARPGDSMAGMPGMKPAAKQGTTPAPRE